MYIIILAFHISGALWLLVTVLASIYAVFKTKRIWLPKLDKMLSFIAIIQVITGVGLWLTSVEQTSLVIFCGKMGIYLAVVFVTKFILIKKLDARAFGLAR